MFNNKTKLIKKSRNNIVTTKENQIGFFENIFLKYKKTIIYKRKKRDRNF